MINETYQISYSRPKAMSMIVVFHFTRRPTLRNKSTTCLSCNRPNSIHMLTNMCVLAEEIGRSSELITNGHAHLGISPIEIVVVVGTRIKKLIICSASK